MQHLVVAMNLSLSTVAAVLALSLAAAASAQPIPAGSVLAPSVSTSAALRASSNLPFIDAAKIPRRGFAGWGKDMLVPAKDLPADSDTGAFRTGCQYSHMSYDDPIAHAGQPGQPGKSPLHVFFGNTRVDASSTAESIANTGNSTCRGGTINRSAYWVPAMIDTRDGTPLKPMGESIFFYQTGWALPPAFIRPMPDGLRMIAGDANGTPDMPSNAAHYGCVWEGGNGRFQKSIPDCPVKGSSWLIMGIDFPQCWDGKNLDSPDHQSHMAHPVNVKANNTGRCPVSHPIAIPALGYQILYAVTEAGATKRWRLSSDNYDARQPGGHSGYGDWFNGWRPEISAIWVQKCDREQRDCRSHLLGDGRAMVIP